MPRQKHTVAYRDRKRRARRRQYLRACERRWNIFHGRAADDNGRRTDGGR